MSTKNIEKLKKSIWIILMMIIFMVPLIVTLKIVPVPSSLQLLYNGQKYSDIFLYGKVQILQGGTLLCVILTIIYQLLSYKKEDWKKNRVSLILLGSFAASIMISFVLSENKQLAWSGMIDRYEGTLTWLCYIGLAYVTMTIIKTKKEMNGLIYAFILSASVVTIIGAFQMFDMDFFKTDIGMLMMLGSRYEELFMNVNFNLPEGRVYTTLYNPNYVGSLVALSFPLTLYSIAVTKRWSLKLLLALSITIQLLALIGSRSTGGFVAVVMSVIFVIVFSLVKFPKNKKIYIGIISTVVIGYLILTQLTIFEPYYNKIMRSLDADPESYFITEFASVEYNHPEIRYYLQNGEYISVSPIEGGLDVESKGEGEVIQDEINERLIYKITSDTYIKQVIYQYKEGLIRINIDNIKTKMWSESRVNYYYEGNFSVGTLPLNGENFQAESVQLFKNERFMSNRGYIWNRMIPIVFNKPMFGYGADTFTVEFPQGDLIYKWQLFGNQAILVDKPHNLFLNIALNFGFVGLLIFVGISLYAIIRSRFDFLMIPIMSYFVVGLINDSVIFASYIMFILFGILIAKRNMGQGEGV